MQNKSQFTIYNASAGSGKTYTLVKDYLRLLFQSKSKLSFRHILALTFTNKAVGEMKERIIDMLRAFSEEKIIDSPNEMFTDLSKDLQISPKDLQEKSKELLEIIVHNYAAFDISTIDKFNHKLIRTFAFDLKLPVNFEVELDTTSILAKAVDKLIDKAGSDNELTKVLVDFAIEKTDDDKSWDISYDFNAIAKLLVTENDIVYLNEIKDKSLSDFKLLKKNIQKQRTVLTSQITEVAQGVLSLIDQSGLEHNDFSSSYLPKHFIKLSEENFNVSFKPKWQVDLIEGGSIYPKRVSAQVGDTIEGLRPQLIDAFLDTKTAVFQIKFLKNALKNITPLSVLSAIGKTLQDIKDEDDILLISEFNDIINTEINQQPAPYIYERIGEKFKHYFIDEFQDTSQLQWENLIPLINNVVSGENLKGETGSAMLVGDAKQAIYRWRGGRAEQFINLYNESEHPLAVQQIVKNLPDNYRSHKTIVEFNNAFFNHIADVAFTNENHQHIYKNAYQNVIINKTGYVDISFLNTENEDNNDLQCEAVLNTIKKAQSNGFKLKDICIIVRKKNEGFAIAEYLSDLKIDIISSESLLLKNSPEVQFISKIITLSLQPQNDTIKTTLLHFIAETKLQLDDTHEFYDDLVHLKNDSFFEKLNTFGFEFNFSEFLQLPIYEAIESIIRGFALNTTSNAYLQFYLDEVFDYSQKYNASFQGFLEYWERKKDSLSIVSPSGQDAIQIMTIHKSKGLEFPVVIFPYANQNIYFNINPKLWFRVNEDDFNGFSHLYINMNEDLESFNELGAEIYTNYRSQLELDSLNLLYVVLTRAVEQLYIISEYDIDKKTSGEKLAHYSGLLINYLKSIGAWQDHQLEYSFGEARKTSEEKVKEEEHTTIVQGQLISTRKEDHNLNIITNSGYLWDTAQEKAINRGDLVHNIMAHVKTAADVGFALEHFLSLGIINTDQYDELENLMTRIINHEQLRSYFDATNTVYNEQDIISKTGKLFRPDRVVVNSYNQATIIDYKTGLQDAKHKEQLFDYQYILEDMNFEVIKKILIYINDEIVIKEF
ncbi:UvrD-helicase domain-containing protein [Psychroserpens damuponensis]|uniref:UvrD-helicase domain-containing protein n=1 Tax=Psychroserpens damuponensis TaxID=943936 RepID=UPI00058E06F5|nr:UvrD-helicase domain-containing protein [Psychroserpens damuponensis]